MCNKSPDATNEVEMNIEDLLLRTKIQVGILAKSVKELHSFRQLLKDAAVDPMPAKVYSYLSPDDYSPDMTDMGFAQTLVKINEETDGDPLRVLISYAQLIKKVKIAKQSFDSKSNKIAARILRGVDGEVDSAKLLKERMAKSSKVCSDRIRHLLDSYFFSRKRIFTAITRVDESILKMFPDGSEELREAYLNNSANAEVETLDLNTKRFAAGEKKVGRKEIGA